MRFWIKPLRAHQRFMDEDMEELSNRAQGPPRVGVYKSVTTYVVLDLLNSRLFKTH